MGLFDSLFGKKKMTLDQANKKNQEYLAKEPVAINEEDDLMRQASNALTNREFEKSIELYQKLANDFPEKKGLYLSQVGANYYFLSDFNQAIEYYITARDNGANSSMMDDNIWESCEALYKASNDTAELERYLEYCPNGSYANKAKKLALYGILWVTTFQLPGNKVNHVNEVLNISITSSSFFC